MQENLLILIICNLWIVRFKINDKYYKNIKIKYNSLTIDIACKKLNNVYYQTH